MHSEYRRHLQNTIHWLIKSRHKLGGSSGFYNPLMGWSKPYPETTGYLIPTLLEYADEYEQSHSKEVAQEFGDWLLSIQNEDGSWNSGLYPSKKGKPSIFNTGQILFGLVSLYKETDDLQWKKSATKAVEWLTSQINDNGLWEGGHYQNFNPTYYSRVAWAVLLAAKTFNQDWPLEKAVSALDTLIKRRNDNGTFDGWGFWEGKPAFTHTISYTLRGFIESSLLINDWKRYGAKVEPALHSFQKYAEAGDGRLAGDYDINWNSNESYTCLTGNLQIAICLMRWYERNNDPKLLQAASNLIEFVNKIQASRLAFGPFKGAVAGSKPIWGKYMRFRYPNWAAKFYADALMLYLKLTSAKNHV